jgi:hypothetical protein
MNTKGDIQRDIQREIDLLREAYSYHPSQTTEDFLTYLLDVERILDGWEGPLNPPLLGDAIQLDFIRRMGKKEE